LVNRFGLDVLATAAHEISGLLTFMIALPIIFFMGQNHVTDIKVRENQR
jgi:hypothetical protein